jgi:uncharacterized protein (TIGR02246 family)
MTMRNPKALRLGAVLLLAVSWAVVRAHGAVESGDGIGVEAVLQAQSEAWNRGDLSAFTSVYAEDATFLSPSGITHGRAEVLARYRKRYPDAKAMGTLTLEILEVRPVPAEGQAQSASVAARWKLSYPGQPDRKTAEGLTLLVLRRAHGSWEIVQDASM